MTTFLPALLAAFFLNLPFGRLRARTRRFSLAWFACVHAPIPMVVAARLALGIGWGAVPFLVAASLAGQVAGGRLFPPAAARKTTPSA